MKETEKLTIRVTPDWQRAAFDHLIQQAGPLSAELLAGKLANEKDLSTDARKLCLEEYVKSYIDAAAGLLQKSRYKKRVVRSVAGLHGRHWTEQELDDVLARQGLARQDISTWNDCFEDDDSKSKAAFQDRLLRGELSAAGAESLLDAAKHYFCAARIIAAEGGLFRAKRMLRHLKKAVMKRRNIGEETNVGVLQEGIGRKLREKALKPNVETQEQRRRG